MAAAEPALDELMKDRRYDEALLLIDEALADEQLERPERARLLLRRGRFLEGLGRRSEAIGSFERAAWLAEVSGTRDVLMEASVAEVMSRVGTDMPPRQLEHRAERAWMLADAMGDPLQRLHAAMVRGYAVLRAGDGERALALELQALERAERELGPDHVDLAYAHDFVAGAYGELDRPEQAIGHKRRALAILERHHGPDHLELVVLMRTSGNVHVLVGRRAEARDLYERGRSIVGRELGDHHPLTRTMDSELGRWWAREGDLDRGLELLASSLVGEDGDRGDRRRALMLGLALEHDDRVRAGALLEVLEAGAYADRDTHGRAGMGRARAILALGGASPDLELARREAESALQVSLATDDHRQELRSRVVRMQVGLALARAGQVASVDAELQQDADRIVELLTRAPGIPRPLRAGAWEVVARGLDERGLATGTGLAHARQQAIREAEKAFGRAHPVRRRIERDFGGTI